MYAEAVREVSLLIEPILDEMQIELVDVEYLSEGGRWVLRIYVDRDGGITLDDCVQVSREIEDLIEVKDVFQQAYVLEVSSPGLNRPLKKEKDFVRAVGENVDIRMAAPVDGRRNFKGRLESFEDGVLCVNVNDDRFHLPCGGVEKANLIYDFGD
jgi:ribosome maturation factor RimP